MIPRPIALGLTLCDQVIVEEGTRKVTFVGTFRRMRGRAFPFTPPPFCVVSLLTGSQGEGDITLTLTNLQTEEEVTLITRQITLSDRFREFRVTIRPTGLIFPEPGHYVFVFTLMVDGEWVAHRRIYVQDTEIDS